ncbi:41538_t:CDS:1, partial [Gigaspora margarita]
TPEPLVKEFPHSLFHPEVIITTMNLSPTDANNPDHLTDLADAAPNHSVHRTTDIDKMETDSNATIESGNNRHK